MLDIKTVQQRLKVHGFDPGPIDGVIGRRTKDAIIDFKQSIGYRANDYVGPLTEAALLKEPGKLPVVPWIVEMQKVIGLHEVRDNAKLRAWLLSDGKTLGNPAALPWCGDGAETAIYRALPNEPRFENPYYARNWANFGRPANKPIPYGAVGYFERGPTSGHVGFLVSQNAENYGVLGANQGDTISVRPISKKRLLGARWPLTYELSTSPLPLYTGNDPVSTNEA
jgi:peptidoglycan hydrolase-like protein with peptidoglycan-binding domain